MQKWEEDLQRRLSSRDITDDHHCGFMMAHWYRLIYKLTNSSQTNSRSGFSHPFGGTSPQQSFLCSAGWWKGLHLRRVVDFRHLELNKSNVKIKKKRYISDLLQNLSIDVEWWSFHLNVLGGLNRTADRLGWNWTSHGKRKIRDLKYLFDGETDCVVFIQLLFHNISISFYSYLTTPL